jgi:hypothetical protein
MAWTAGHGVHAAFRRALAILYFSLVRFSHGKPDNDG